MRRVSEKSLGNAALFYLRRYSATAARLRSVLKRKAARAGKGQADLDPAEVERWLTAVVERMVRAGYVAAAGEVERRRRSTSLHEERDADRCGAERCQVAARRFAQGRTASLRRSGKSARAVGAALRVKGVSAAHAAEALAAADPDAVAVWTFARKRRLGVYRGAARPEGWRLKDLARIARAGFSYALARRVVDAAEPPPLDPGG